MDPAAVIKNIPDWEIKRRRELTQRYLEIAQGGGPDSTEARKIFDAIWDFEVALYRDQRKATGMIDWEPHLNQYIVRGYHDGALVATITYGATHRTHRKEVFSLRMSPELSVTPAAEPYHHIDQAREAASTFFLEGKFRE